MFCSFKVWITCKNTLAWPPASIRTTTIVEELRAEVFFLQWNASWSCHAPQQPWYSCKYEICHLTTKSVQIQPWLFCWAKESTKLQCFQQLSIGNSEFGRPGNILTFQLNIYTWTSQEDPWCPGVSLLRLLLFIGFIDLYFKKKYLDIEILIYSRTSNCSYSYSFFMIYFKI